VLSDDRLTEALWRLTRLIRRSVHPVRRSEITPEQYWLLKRVNRVGPLSVGALAEGLGLTSASVTAACKRLEKAGLVRRARQPESEDERVVLVSLTDRGLDQLEAWQQDRQIFISGLLAELRPDERAQLLQLVERVLANTSMELEPPATGGDSAAGEDSARAAAKETAAADDVDGWETPVPVRRDGKGIG
jgi:DNA-binding MarR family transcriptional regulator